MTRRNSITTAMGHVVMLALVTFMVLAVSCGDKSSFEEDDQIELPELSLPLASSSGGQDNCYPVYSFDTVGPYRQDPETKSKSAREKIYYFTEQVVMGTDQIGDTILTKDEFGLVCFTKTINCSLSPTATSATSKKTPNCIFFEKELCTRNYAQMKWKGMVCPPLSGHQHSSSGRQDVQCELSPLGKTGAVEAVAPSSSSKSNNDTKKSLFCKHSDSLCLLLKPPFYTRSGGGGDSRNPPTQGLCLCPLGYTGSNCGRMDIDLFHLDLLHNIDLRNILLKYQQKDRYFIGATLLLLLVVTLFSVLLVVAGCSFLYVRIPKFPAPPKPQGTGSKADVRCILRKGEGRQGHDATAEEDLTGTTSEETEIIIIRRPHRLARYTTLLLSRIFRSDRLLQVVREVVNRRTQFQFFRRRGHRQRSERGSLRRSQSRPFDSEEDNDLVEIMRIPPPPPPAMMMTPRGLTVRRNNDDDNTMPRRHGVDNKGGSYSHRQRGISV